MFRFQDAGALNPRQSLLPVSSCRVVATEKSETNHNFRIPKNERRWGHWSSPTCADTQGILPPQVSRAPSIDVAHDLTATRGLRSSCGRALCFPALLMDGSGHGVVCRRPPGSLMGFPWCRKMKSWAKRARWGQGGLRFRIKPTKWAPRCQGAASRRTLE